MQFTNWSFDVRENEFRRFDSGILSAFSVRTRGEMKVAWR